MTYLKDIPFTLTKASCLMLFHQYPLPCPTPTLTFTFELPVYHLSRDNLSLIARWFFHLSHDVLISSRDKSHLSLEIPRSNTLEILSKCWQLPEALTQMTALRQQRPCLRHSTFVFKRCEALISRFTLKFVFFPKKTYILHIYMILIASVSSTVPNKSSQLIIFVFFP